MFSKFLSRAPKYLPVSVTVFAVQITPLVHIYVQKKYCAGIMFFVLSLCNLFCVKARYEICTYFQEKKLEIFYNITVYVKKKNMYKEKNLF